jgi:hypothetical protein
MERAPLRPIPSRPAGPVDRDDAVAHVRERLPGLDPAGATALALTDLTGAARPAVAADLGLGDEPTALALAAARKALRRRLASLPGSGWCERAELLVSDRLDGVLEPPGDGLLDVHLRRCSRCVEHERRLVQAIDELAAEFAATRSAQAPAATPEPEPDPVPPPVLHIVEPPPRPAPPARPAPAARPASAPAPAPAPQPLPAPERAPAAVGALLWRALGASSIALALVSVVLTVLGLLGGEL